MSRYLVRNTVFAAVIGLCLSCSQERVPEAKVEPEVVAYLTYVEPIYSADELMTLAKDLAWDAYYEEAAGRYQEALIKYGEEQDADGIFSASLGFGVQLREMGQYDSSMVVLEHLIGGNGGAPKPNGRKLTDALQERGSTLIRLSRFPEAVTQFKRVIRRRKNEHPRDSTDVGRAYHGLGWAYHEIQDADGAITNFETALKWYDRSLVGRFERSRSLNSLGASKKALSFTDDAIHLFEQSFDIRARLFRSDHPQLAIPLMNKALTNISFDRFTTGIDEYSRAATILENRYPDNHPELARVFNNLGSFHLEFGELRKASIYLNQALSIRNAIYPGLHRDFYHSYFEMSRLNQRLGKLEEAKRFVEMAEEVLRLYNDAWIWTLELETVSAEIARAEGDHSREVLLLESIQKLLSSHDETHPLHRIRTKTALARALFDNDDWRRSRLVATEAYEAVTASLDEGHPLESELLLILSNSSAALADSAKSQEFLMRSAVTFDGLDAEIKSGAWQMLLGWEIHNQLGSRPYFKSQEQLGHLETANDLSIELRKALSEDLSKLSVVKETHISSKKAFLVAKSLFEQTHETQFKYRAFRAAEQGRAGVLLDAISESHARRFSSIPDSLLSIERDLRYALSESAKSTPGASEAQNTVRFDATRKYSRLIREFEENYPDYYNLKHNTSIASVSEVQSALTSDEVLLEYTVSDSIYVFGISPDTSIFLTLAPIDSLDSNVQRLLRGITEQRYGMFTMTAEKLYDLLIRPLEQFIAEKQLVIVPDGLLNYVPFESLLPRHVPLDIHLVYTILPFMIRDYPMSYSYSATLFTQLRKLPASDAKYDFVGMAPVFLDSNSTSTSSRDFLARRQQVAGKQQAYLPGSLDEVLSIQKTFRKSYSLRDRFLRERTYVLLNENASEETVKSIPLSDYRYVHFATHAFADDVNADKSGLVLTSEEGSGEDGILSLAEVYNLKLNADIVVLSACETGLGKLESGEGMVGLTRGFLYAGSNNVVVSLWKASDTATRNLMIPFYESLVRKHPPVIALQKAKIHAIERSRFHARPYFWAQFIMHGK